MAGWMDKKRNFNSILSMAHQILMAAAAAGEYVKIILTSPCLTLGINNNPALSLH